jgi:hypothetical protein
MKSYRITMISPGMTHHYLVIANDPDDACFQLTEQMKPLYREFRILQVRQEFIPPPAFAGDLFDN